MNIRLNISSFLFLFLQILYAVIFEQMIIMMYYAIVK